jgi:peptidyl-prolyl cis-trans isomerase SurA
MRHLCRTVLLALALAAQPGLAQQNPFAAAITVDDHAVTWWEIDQRERLLRTLNAPGDPVREARQGLIDDRLRDSVAAAAGFALPDEELEAEIAAFAERGGLDLDQLLTLLAREGVALETLRDFVRSQLTWRAIIQGRYAGRVQITEAEIDRALALAEAGSGTSVLLSELILPLTPQLAEANQALARQLSETIDSFAEFEAAARQYSVAPSAPAGGRIDWIALSELPPSLRAVLLTLAPGDVTEPLVLPEVIVLFQLRGLDERAVPLPPPAAIDYLQVLIPGGRSEAALTTAATLAGRMDTCDDIHGQGRLIGAMPWSRQSRAPAALPRDVALELARLDPGEVSATLTADDGAALRFLMLCGRVWQPAELTEETAQAREAARRALLEQRLQSHAESFLAELRAEARIVER